jgi:O-antigen/teichoic acid export membrane protein
MSRAGRIHPMIHAALAMGIAGAGRIALNSLIAIGLGQELYGRYAGHLSGVMLAGGVASSGPYGAITLGVARKWADASGGLPRALVRLHGVIGALFLLLLTPVCLWAVGTTGTVWLPAALVYGLYQLLRAFGYAVQRADLVTTCEAVGAAVPIAAVIAIVASGIEIDVVSLVLVYTAGPAIFTLALPFFLRRTVRLAPDAVDSAERRLAIRESLVFFVGAGCSTAMQFLPTVLAGKLDSTAAAAILFGALHATSPLLLLSRVYMTVMMPAIASGDEARSVESHMEAVRAIFLPSLAIAFGAAPWVVLSLGMEIDLFTVSTAAMVGLTTLFQVWSTPAVTALSASHRELVPALASVGGLVIASCVWWVAMDRGSAALLPVGLVAGSFVRGLVPAWIGSGRAFGRIDLRVLKTVLLACAMCGVVWSCGVVSLAPSLAIGAALALFGLMVIVVAWRRRAERVHEDPPRQ